jgi:hypothetical protein
MNDEPYELPEGWVWAKIGNVVRPVGQFNPSTTPEAVYRYVDVSSISNQRFEIETPEDRLWRHSPHASSPSDSSRRCFGLHRSAIPAEYCLSAEAD